MWSIFLFFFFWLGNILILSVSGDTHGNGIGGVFEFLNKRLDLLADPDDKTVFLLADEGILYIGVGVCGSIFCGISVSNISATVL